jgi:cell wall-associated NlpC family hydrolase
MITKARRLFIFHVTAALLAFAAFASATTEKPLSAVSSGKANPAVTQKKKHSSQEARNSIVTCALSLVGIPYKYGGSTKRGFDCCGFVMYVYALNDIRLPRTSRQQFTAGKQIDLEDIEKGDLLFYKINTSAISHVGIYIGDGQFVHSSVPGSCVRVERIDQPYWVKYYAGAATFL